MSSSRPLEGSRSFSRSDFVPERQRGQDLAIGREGEADLSCDSNAIGSARCRPLAVSQSWTTPSAEDEARILPSGESARHRTFASTPANGTGASWAARSQVFRLAVVPDGRQVLAVGGYGEGRDGSAMRADAKGLQVTVGGVPAAERPVGPARDQGPAVGQERQRAGRPGVRLQGDPLGTPGDIPEPRLAVAA